MERVLTIARILEVFCSCCFVELFPRGGETAAVLTLDTAVESRKEMIADGVARSPDSPWSRDGNPSYYHRLEYDFLFRILACFWSCFSLCALVFLPRAVLAPVSSSSSCYLARAAVFSSCSLSDLLAPFVFCVISGFLLFRFYCHFFCYYFLVRLVFVMLSYPVR